MNEEMLANALGALLAGKPVEQVVPILIVAAARALMLEADGDEAKLARMLNKFDELLADEAFDMMNSKQTN